MFSSPKVLVTCLLLATLAHADDKTSSGFPGIGRSATPAEVKAWDIEVRPDFKGLPPGRGTVAQGQDIWESKCASCHGVFGESNEVFTPLIGGTTQDDIKTGHVAALSKGGYPDRTLMMKISQISTLWDYINRAMPWTSPRSLKPDEVYAVSAYLLSLADVLPDAGELSNLNIAEVQQRLPNRNGKSNFSPMWPGDEFGANHHPDVQGSACMHGCAAEPSIASFMPDSARRVSGNLADQQRLIGPQRGQQTGPSTDKSATPAPPAVRPISDLLSQHACLACHQVDHAVVGPALRDVAARYAGRVDAVAYFTERLKTGSAGRWGTGVMPPQQLPDDDLQALANWLAQGAKP